MIRGTTFRRAGLVVLAAAPLALQIAAEARQAASGAADARSPRVLRDPRAPGARGQLLRLPRRRADGRPAPRFARGAAQRRQVRPGDCAWRSRQEPVDRSGAADARDPEDAERRPPRRDGGRCAGRMGQGRGAVGHRRGHRDEQRLSVRCGRQTPPAAPAPGGYVIKPEQRAFWSFQPIRVAPVPAVSHTSWPKTDIDRYVLARLERAGLTPVRAADKRTLIRRATLDLIGLPPTPEEIEAFDRDAVAGRIRQGDRSPAGVAAVR